MLTKQAKQQQNQQHTEPTQPTTTIKTRLQRKQAGTLHKWQTQQQVNPSTRPKGK
jgi:hypothetical protein